MTSPPYFALRSYRDGCPDCDGGGRAPKTATHVEKVCGACGNRQARKRCSKCGGRMLWPEDRVQAVAVSDCETCNGTGSGHYDGQIGSEDTPQQFISELVGVLDGECRRVLKPSGSMWINLGDKYAGSGGHNNSNITDKPRGPSSYNKAADVKAKSLMGLPWRVALALIDKGWILRAEVIWDKPNGLPESVTDRVRRSHEQWFHFTKEPKYFAAVDEIREQHKRPIHAPGSNTQHRAVGRDDGDYEERMWGNPLGRLPGSVWAIPSEPLLIPDAVREVKGLPDHFAAFPQEWPRRLIQGWSPSGICVVCGEGRAPVYRNDKKGTVGAHNHDRVTTRHGLKGSTLRNVQAGSITAYECGCDGTAPTTPATVLDPFGGTGTVAGVAKTLGRIGISVDLSEDYCRLAEWRIHESGHFQKTEGRYWKDRQLTLG